MRMRARADGACTAGARICCSLRAHAWCVLPGIYALFKDIPDDDNPSLVRVTGNKERIPPVRNQRLERARAILCVSEPTRQTQLPAPILACVRALFVYQVSHDAHLILCIYTLCVPVSSAQGGEAAQTYGVDLDSNTRERGGTTSPRRRAWTGREEDRRRAKCSWPASYIRAFGRPCLRPPQRP